MDVSCGLYVDVFCVSFVCFRSSCCCSWIFLSVFSLSCVVHISCRAAYVLELNADLHVFFNYLPAACAVVCGCLLSCGLFVSCNVLERFFFLFFSLSAVHVFFCVFFRAFFRPLWVCARNIACAFVADFLHVFFLFFCGIAHFFFPVMWTYIACCVSFFLCGTIEYCWCVLVVSRVRSSVFLPP